MSKVTENSGLVVKNSPNSFDIWEYRTGGDAKYRDAFFADCLYDRVSFRIVFVFLGEYYVN